MKETVARIKKLAESNAATIRELADIAGCSKSAMQRYISGDREIPTNVISGIATAYNVHPAYLMGWVDDKNYSIKEQSTESELSIKKKEFIQKVEKMTDAQIERLEQILALVEKTDL